jgi:prolyl-tRNA synthetase
MRVQHLFGETLRNVPAEADFASHQLLLRAGYVRQLAAGIFSYLPLAWRSLNKISTILREEMDRIGGQEINMPVVHPAEPWQKSGRWSTVDETMVRFRDRRGHDMLLAMTHEEIVAVLAAGEVRSWRQLPQLVYQLQTKFRDEARARGGLIRVREFVMKDSYSLDRDTEGLRRQYDAHYVSYLRIGARVGLPLVAVQSDTGMMGGRVAHEFMYETPIGEDGLIRCSACDYAANREVARFRRTIDKVEGGAMERVATPGATTIEQVSEFLKVPLARIAKTVFFTGRFAEGGPRLVLAVVPGDREANPTQVQNLAQALELRAAHPEEIAAAGAVAGYGSPIGVDGRAVVVADEAVVEGGAFVMGANLADHHVRDAVAGRDWKATVTGAIALADDGSPCEKCGSPLRLVRGVEVGNIFQLGTRYSEAAGANYLDETGRTHPIVMGSYGIGVGRLLACVAEEHRDDRGLCLPVSVAPYHVALLSLGKTDRMREAAERLYGELQAAGVEVLFDDRDVGAGVKFADADLRGMPVRVVVSDRTTEAGAAEVTPRREKTGAQVPLGEVTAAVKRMLADLESELASRVAAVAEPATTTPAS